MSKQLILNLHGIGHPHCHVERDERHFWWSQESLHRLLEEIAERTAEKKPEVVVTFDDGNLSDATVALPALVRRGLKASFFVCAGRIGQQHYLDPAAIHDLLSAGMTVGSHGMNHRDWRQTTDAELDEEIIQARRKLEDVCAGTVTSVSIPFGLYNRRVIERLRRQNFDVIYTSDRGVAHAFSTIKPRETLDCSMEVDGLVARLATPRSAAAQIGSAVKQLCKRWRQ